MIRRVALAALLALIVFASACLGFLTASAGAQEASWSGLEQPVPAGSQWPIGLGNIGDIEFWAPNRGLLITEGHAPTVPAGLWSYNGAEWHEYATVCGASAKAGARNNGGRIAWAGANEFWTVSDGRKGQANESAGTDFEREPPLEDNTLCHFVGGQVAASYAHPAFQADSYQLMHAAACIDATDCWFGGEPLAEPQIGAFQLHWNGSSLEEEPYPGEGHAIQDMRALAGRIYESVLIEPDDPVVKRVPEPPVLHKASVDQAFEAEAGEIPLYAAGELPEALDFLHLAAAEEALWGAAGARPTKSGTPGQVTVVRRVAGIWTQLIGPEHPLAAILPGEPAAETALLGGEAKTALVNAIAVEPGSGAAWLALAPPEESAAAKSSVQRAVLLHVSADGAVLGETTLPSTAEEEQGVGPKGQAARLACPAVGDCWLATTQGWLFHLAPAAQRTLPRDTGEAEYFHGVITYRPPDQGLPQVTPDAPPEDDSGIPEGPPPYGLTLAEPATTKSETKVTVPLLSHLRTRLIHGTTLQLSFHLAVKAQVRLIAKRHKRVVASTPNQTFEAGNRSLRLQLNRRAWPTKLGLQTHALARLPTEAAHTVGGNQSNTVTTGFAVLPSTPTFSETDTLP